MDVHPNFKFWSFFFCIIYTFFEFLSLWASIYLWKIFTLACFGSSLSREVNYQSFDLLPLLIFKSHALFMLIISIVPHTYQLHICNLSTYHLSVYLPIYLLAFWLIETGSYLVVQDGPNLGLSFLSLLSVPSIFMTVLQKKKIWTDSSIQCL